MICCFEAEKRRLELLQAARHVLGGYGIIFMAPTTLDAILFFLELDDLIWELTGISHYTRGQLSVVAGGVAYGLDCIDSDEGA